MTDRYIDTPEGLEELCNELGGSQWLTLDTEFIREKTYYPRLCLLQVANESVVACVDPLALANLDPLLDVLYDPAITKVLHAAHQDLEILFGLRGTVPAPIFDTQIAATVLGGGDQIGYGNLVKTELGIELEKAHARADWCRRPLEQDQIKYAADDVRYLRDIYHRQFAQLVELDREEWLIDDFATLSDPERYTNSPEQAWQRIKGAGRLKGVQLAVLQQLAAWREQRAVAADRPRRWIVADAILLDIARHMPDSLTKLERIRGVEEKLIKRDGQVLLERVASGRKAPRDTWPEVKEGPRLAPEQDEVVDTLMAVLRARCRARQVSPAAVANRRDLERLVLGERDLPLLRGWRHAVAGADLQAMLEGSMALSIQEGRLAIEAAPTA
ncbi:ribonuclease D [Thiohalomonas denitrificans]|uniref:Ribonuclease D n=1 Tax=Thiohalomonas denitrificans TaxID=415747 RepID=A0A1G5Q721_9GAMM|nr:ribonuclease D [Thiohalomonas denitrificans]SCZ57654.1 ribonuclease D [Thiohalomonas denitrificans]